MRHWFPLPPQLTSASCCLFSSHCDAPGMHPCAVELVFYRRQNIFKIIERSSENLLIVMEESNFPSWENELATYFQIGLTLMPWTFVTDQDQEDHRASYWVS